MFFIVTVNVIFSPGFGASGFTERDSIVRSGGIATTFTIFMNPLFASLLSYTAVPESTSPLTSIWPSVFGVRENTTAVSPPGKSGGT